MSYLVQLNKSNYVEIKPCGPFPKDTVPSISKARGISPEEVRTLLAYNVVTFPQLAILTGVSESQLRNASVPSIKRNGEPSCWLTLCNPFPDEKKGKLFILVNDKCLEYIRRTIK